MIAPNMSWAPTWLSAELPLRDLGGFDVAYTSAGDDVDICWRLLDAGHEIGFAHARAGVAPPS